MKKLLIRTLSGSVYVAIVLLSIYLYHFVESRKIGYVALASLFFVVAMIGVNEYYRNIRKRGVQVNAGLGFVVAVLTYGLIVLSHVARPVFMQQLLCMLPAVALLVPLVQLWRHDEQPMTTVAHTLLPTIWVVIPLSLLPLVWIWHPFLAVMLFVCIWTNDSFAYLTGMTIGKHKMWTRHSPNKTWEGTIGGVVFCMIAALLMGRYCYNDELFYAGPLSWYHWMALGLICSVMGTLGDLVESMFKRSCGVKDSGNIMPGHGGVLDRFDSLLFAIPFVVAIFSFIIKGGF